jgi:hypothetical protein
VHGRLADRYDASLASSSAIVMPSAVASGSAAATIMNTPTFGAIVAQGRR